MHTEDVLVQLCRAGCCRGGVYRSQLPQKDGSDINCARIFFVESNDDPASTVLHSHLVA